ncbi:hypothetical protein CC80DRAFT_462673 [Byssothecium circinans]|uniref:RING-type domain-containing protein n=1 Tax=Byssothecium circinans TaxID=147558 RepID=A0A6A5UC61_9PLEO|nr:hypothetical protein CC80DRAFT_462673 [Byssothecium circinans]
MKPRSVVHEEFSKARVWLLGVVRMQEKVYDKSHLYRLFRAGIEREAKQTGDESTRDLERLYMALTHPDEDDLDDDDEWDYEDHLEVAFLITMHYNYAEKYANVLQKLQERTARRPNKSLSPIQRITRRVIEKTESTKVDGFACAIPLAAIKVLPEEDQACGICQHAYLDLHSFPVEDLIADYPVRIKYCGHIFGKQCLETWMDTPLIDAAKYPFHTCPVCRVKIEGRATPQIPRELIKHVSKGAAIKAMIKESDDELDEVECRHGILRCVSEDVALKELSREVEGLRLAGKLKRERLRQCTEALEGRMKEIGEEKRVWGFVGQEKEKVWRSFSEEWERSSVGN